jgi:short-subunit dehydrogenase
MAALHSFRSILITGASSGLGRALAEELAAPGVRLVLGGRDRLRLSETARAAEAAGASVHSREIDVTDASRVAEWVCGEDAIQPFDLVIANAGVSGETGAPGDHPGQSEWIYRVNVLGMLNTVEPLLPAMRMRRRGQIGVVSSVAGFRGSSHGPAYAASKAAMAVQSQGWREALAPDNIGVTTICPGYIRTAMTARHKFRMPFVMEPDVAARRTIAALAANRSRLVFPWPLPIVAWLFRALPLAATAPMMRRRGESKTVLGDSGS